MIQQRISSDRLRVATLQYYIRPVDSFAQFESQVAGLVETAADYRCGLVVFPEYFSTQLLTLNDVKRPIRDQIRDLAEQKDRVVEMMSKLAQKHKIYICGGTIPAVNKQKNHIENLCYFYGPSGEFAIQGKLHMTRFEAEEWFVQPSEKLKVIETSFGKVAIAICYDVEFPELVRAAARKGARILIVPSCTDDRQGWLRVRYCAQARAIENQMYVIHSSTVGSLPMVPAVSLNYGQSSILTPSDFAFSRDGILAEGIPNQETMVLGELNLATLQESLDNGTVLPLRDSERSAELVSKIEFPVIK
ncbi:MAG: carbon-nitrogen hydrolase family protein [Bdellovibrionota bacterium]